MADGEVVADEVEEVPESPTLYNSILFEEGQPEPSDELTLQVRVVRRASAVSSPSHA